MSNTITKDRKLIYLLIAGILPLFFITLIFSSKESSQKALLSQVQEAIFLAEQKSVKEYRNRQVKKLYANADHFWIDKEIETIKPLQDEIALIKQVMQKGYHPNEDEMRRRLTFLTSGQNSISFTEGSIKNYKEFQETVETLSHPVDVGIDDLKCILSKIEQTALSDCRSETEPPHLIITECKLDRKKGVLQDSFQLDLKVLKREYLQ